MLEMKPDGGIETGPGSDPGPVISFEMPAHEMCLERRAVLSRLDGQSEYMSFAIDFMPDVIWIDGRKFKYSGVSDGRGFYREIETRPLSLRIAESIDVGLKAVCSHGTPFRYPCEDCDREDELVRGADGSDMIGDDTPVEELKAEWADRERAGTKNPAQMVQDFISSALAAGEPLERIFGSVGNPPFSLDSMHEIAENATPNPRMQCFRCSELLDLVSQMIENPPGLSGIRCHLGHVGNHYVDAGWVEALTRVKWHLVTDGHGTREEI